MLADLILGKEGPGALLAARSGVRLPPEPLRWLGFRAVVAALRLRDRRVDCALDSRLGPSQT
jgi:hypothetical protein